MLKPKCFLPREALTQPDAVLFSCLHFIPGLHVALKVLPGTFFVSCWVANPNKQEVRPEQKCHMSSPSHPSKTHPHSLV